MRGSNNIIVATHVFSTGASQALLEYLNTKKTANVLFLGHPLVYDKRLKGSGYEYYSKGELIKDKYRPLKRRLKIFEYTLQVWLNIYYVVKTFKRWKLFIGNDNLNAFSGLILKKLGLVKKVVYYTIDYNPQRFENRLANFIYHFIDRWCVKHCDETWNVSPRMEDARVAYYGLRGGVQKVVPMGVWSKRINHLPMTQIQKNTLVFMGHVTKRQGIVYVMDAIPTVVKSIPDFKFLIVGDGDYLVYLKRHVKKLKLGKYVKFVGYVDDHVEVEKILCKCGVGIALYDLYIQKDMLSFTYFADPAKLKVYMACGLPVLLTDVPYNALKLEKEGVARVISQDTESISKGIIDIMSGLNGYREKVLLKKESFDWENIFTEALKSVS